MIVFVIIIQMKTRGNHQRCSIRKGVLRNFAKFTGKHLWQVLFYNKVAGLEKFCEISKNTFSQSTSEQLLDKTALPS